MSPTAGADRLRAALAELVACKDLKERVRQTENDCDGVSDEEWLAMHNDYERRQPLAWVEAREVLALSPIETTAPATEPAKLSDEQLEKVEVLVYEAMKFDQPKWVPWVRGGNADAQYHARRLAESILAAAGVR